MFDDLDEIIARFVEPLTENVRELTGHRKYLEEVSMAFLLRAAELCSSGVIAWG